MKRLVLAAVAASMLAVPVMQAEAAPMVAPAMPQSNLAQVDWKKPNDRRHMHKPPVVQKKIVRKSHWKRGQKYSDWRRYKAVNDYHRYGLKRPGHGQRWIRVGNDYLLVGIASGLIGAMIAAR